MDPIDRIRRISDALLFSSRLRDEGVHQRAIARALTSGAWTPVGRGVYVESRAWSAWFADERHIARALAVHARAAGRRPVFSHLTAAALLGVHGYRLDHEPVHLVVRRRGSAGAAAGVVRHLAAPRPDEIVEIAGLRCTSLPRTLLDIARAASAEQAVIGLDSGLRLLTGADAARQHAFRERAAAQLRELAGHRGVHRALRRIAFADHRADSPPESLSRLQLDRIGYRVDIQVPVASPRGGCYSVDFEFIGLGLFGEVDGDVKYTDAAMRGSRTAEQVVLDEKHREDWIRGTTGKRLIRWGFAASRTVSAMTSQLRAFGVPPP